jgi:hypothetical protein
MQIYFGDNYFSNQDTSFWTDVLINCIGAFVGFFLSLTIYRHQIKKDKRKENNHRDETYKGLLRYFSSVIDTFEKDSVQQLKLLEIYIADQLKDTWDLKILPRIPTNDFTRLINNDNKEVFEAWINNVSDLDNIAQYRKVTASIDIIEGVIQELHRIYKYRIEKNHSKLYDVKLMVDNLPDRLSSIALKIYNSDGEERLTNSFYHMINSYIGIYGQLLEENANIKRFMDELIGPTLREFYENYRDNPHTDEIATMCKKARVKFHEVEVDMTAMANDFKKVRGKIEPSILVLQNFVIKVGKII